MARPTSNRNRDAFALLVKLLMTANHSVAQLMHETGLCHQAVLAWLNNLHSYGVVYRADKIGHTIFWRWQPAVGQERDRT